MSGLDPLAAFALQAVANAQAAIEEATLNLGSLINEFQAQLNVGDVVRATVLPPQNGSDRLSLLGRTLDAQLPPGINPGETIALQVTGFTNSAIVVRNLGVVDAQTQLPSQTPAQPQPSPVQPQVPPQAQAPTATQGTRPPVAIPPNAPAQSGPAASSGAPPPRPVQPPVARPAPGPVAPPREVFVQASVRPTAAAPSPVAQAAPPPAELETRLIATRAAAAGSLAKTVPVPSPNPQNAARPDAQPRVSPVSSQAAAQAAVTRASIERALQPAPAEQAPATPEAGLLARLRVPLTPTTLAAARIVDTATRALTEAFEKLDVLLDKAPVDARTSTLRSTLAFVSRFDLRNTRALPEQIASYVSNVVSSAESKIAQIVRAWSEATVMESVADQPPATTAPASQPPAQGGSAPAESPASSQPALQQQAPVAVAARAAERSVALEHDVKAALIQLVANPPQNTSPQLVAALRDALTATTAVQLNALTPQNNNAQTITIPLPAYFYEGGQPAQLRISRDAPNGKKSMDAENFHITFVLDTKSLGTVGIDVQTVGRSVSVDVKTETPRSADRFRTSFADLRSRLENLHYRIATMAAGLVPVSNAKDEPAARPVEELRNRSNVDIQA